MLTINHLTEILKEFRSAQNEGQLHAVLAKVTHILGFTQFAMGHHVDLVSPPVGAIRLTTYNEDWVDHVQERRYFCEDPIHLASSRTVTGFLWRDVASIVALTPRHKQILAEAVGFGLGGGFTVPVHLPGEYQGSCSFAAPSLDGIGEDSLSVAQLCGTFAFEAARRIMRRSMKIELPTVPELRPRELEALILVGSGKTDGDIGHLLGVSRNTAHEHVEGARRAYGNAQRAYMIVRALFDGQISFADILRR